uniref:Uncharacterized protein n=1 Tax=Marseillevirus sp. TaxID=2809551 RepID=A0AA96ENZ9_9VIRU|nr:hypothetical protein MarFTMF_047 [Marseillevirus sp.]
MPQRPDIIVQKNRLEERTEECRFSCGPYLSREEHKFCGILVFDALEDTNAGLGKIHCERKGTKFSSKASINIF